VAHTLMIACGARDSCVLTRGSILIVIESIIQSSINRWSCVNLFLSEFVWSPSSHHLVRASKYCAFRKSVLELFMIRDLGDQAMVWLPNELMFTICRSLFQLYDC